MSGENEPPIEDADPIDADFEPAPIIDDVAQKPRSKTSGPGWIALGVTGILAAVLGGGASTLLAPVLGSVEGKSYAPKTLVSDVEVLAEGQLGQEDRLIEMIGELGKSLRGEMSTVAASGGDADAIADLTAQLAGISAQLEAAEVNAQEAGEGDGLQFDEVLARVEALETLDEDEVASPRVANRTIKLVQRRIEELEAEITTRNEVLKSLEDRLAGAETRLENMVGSIDDATTAANEQTAGLLLDLREDVDALKAVRTDELGDAIAENTKDLETLRSDMRALAEASADDGDQAGQNERLTRWVEELRAQDAETRTLIARGRDGQTAAFSMLSIEAAARDGRSFQSAFARLDEALPRNRSVAKLKPLAAKGAPTIALLQKRFDTARAAAAEMKTEPQSEAMAEIKDAQDGWGWVRSALGDAVVVRRSNSASPEDDADFVTAMETAQAALTARDLETAIATVKALDGPRKDVFSDWLAGADNRLTLEQGLDELRLTLMDTER